MATGRTPYARPTFRYPFAGDYPISSPYGLRGTPSMHTGVDFSIPSGVDILASNDGEVIYCAYESGAATRSRFKVPTDGSRAITT